jgi:hypothetical protein
MLNALRTFIYFWPLPIVALLVSMLGYEIHLAKMNEKSEKTHVSIIEEERNLQ